MRITDSTLQSSSQRSYFAAHVATQSVRIDVQARAPQQSSDVELSPAALDASRDDAGDSVDPRLALLIRLIETITGEKLDLPSWQTSTQLRPIDAPQSAPANSPPAEPIWSVDIEQSSSKIEAESTQYAASGQVTTADGRQISFDFGLSMKRLAISETRSSTHATNAPATRDPLVLSLNGSAPGLSGNWLSFDLNSDGQANEKLAGLTQGSGYLVLDRDRNGKIESGKELFGPTSNEGFDELAAFDSDHNGWIDENDPAFTQLGVWRPGDGIQSLKEANVGAIALDHASTTFSLQNGQDTLGKVRSTGIYLTEDGEARAVQQIDFVA